MSAEWIIALNAAIVALTGFLTWFLSKRRLAVEADSLTVTGSLQLVKTALEQGEYLDREMTKLRAKIDEYRGQLEEAMRKVAKYRQQLEEAVLTEQRLSSEIRDLREKVRVLYDFIVAQGLEPPIGINST